MANVSEQEAGLKTMLKYADIGMALLVVLIVGMMIIPLPTALLDILLSMNITFGVVILLTTFYVKRALEIAAFPTILLMATLFRLALNVSTTRLILLQGYAGEVISAFGNFVVGGNYVVGGVVFLILVIIQFIVITQGRGTGGRGGGAFHPGRHAGQADGHRCRSQRRAHRGGRGPEAPGGDPA
jgi:flagellar biosynthesis protein FlhA